MSSTKTSASGKFSAKAAAALGSYSFAQKVWQRPALCNREVRPPQPANRSRDLQWLKQLRVAWWINVLSSLQNNIDIYNFAVAANKNDFQQTFGSMAPWIS
jgi:hypothetical protein